MRRAARLVLLLLALLAFAGAVADGAGAATPEAQVEAERFKMVKGASVVNDGSASAGQAVKVASAAAPYGMFTFPAGDAITLRLRGDQCDGAPAASLELDGKVLGEVTVTSTTWVEHRIPASVAAGDRWIAVRFTNDRITKSCDRNIYLDWVRVDVAPSAPAPDPVPPAPEPTPPSDPAPPDPGRVEAERFKLVAGASIVQDPEASGGQAVLIDTNAAPYGLFPFPGGDRVALRLRGDQCDGSPVAAIELDGKSIGTLTVASKTWSEQLLSSQVSAGDHWIAVRFTNDRRTKACNRNLYVDWVRVDATATAVSPAPVFEAERFAAPSGSSVVADGTASGGQAIKVAVQSAPYGLFTLPAGQAVTLRLRGDQCEGAPVAALEVDNVSLGGVPVSSTGWTDYQLAGAVAAGDHWVAIRFGNDRVTVTCDRSLYIDWIRVDPTTGPALVPHRGINTGDAGSLCQGKSTAGTVPGPGVVASPLVGAPAYHEIGAPSGAFGGTAPKGIVLVVHGGGWSSVGRGAVSANRPEADAWRARGWETWNVSYRPCDQSLDDVLWFFDQAQATAGDLPLCATGASAGGHLVVMAAALRPTLDCVVAKGAPLDLTAILRDVAFDPGTGTYGSAGPTVLHHWAVAAWGESRLADVSPALRAGDVAARVLIATAERDIFVSTTQGTRFAAAYDQAHPATPAATMVLAPGTIQWVHAPVSVDALAALTSQEDLLAGSLLPPPAAPEPEDGGEPTPEGDTAPTDPALAEPPVDEGATEPAASDAAAAAATTSEPTEDGGLQGTSAAATTGASTDPDPPASTVGTDSAGDTTEQALVPT